MKSKKKYAKADSLDIRPVVDSSDSFNFFFRDEIFARKKIMLIKEKYIISRENDMPPSDEDMDKAALTELEQQKKNEVILWIRNYEVTPEERLAGYKGNFARIFIKEVKDEELEFEDELESLGGTPSNREPLFNGDPFYTLCIEKISRRVSRHPDRKVIKRRHPNWGHPILRQIKHRPDHIHNSYYAAFSELRRLHRDYPEVSYLTKQLLYIIVYGKAKEGTVGFASRPIQKIILEVKEVGEDQFKIAWRPNPVIGKLTREKINMVTFSLFN